MRQSEGMAGRTRESRERQEQVEEGENVEGANEGMVPTWPGRSRSKLIGTEGSMWTRKTTKITCAWFPSKSTH